MRHPDIRWLRKPKRGAGRRCDVCDGKATYQAEIETSWFRGDDELVVFCEEHKPLVETNPMAVVMAMKKKKESQQVKP